MRPLAHGLIQLVLSRPFLEYMRGSQTEKATGTHQQLGSALRHSHIWEVIMYYVQSTYQMQYPMLINVLAMLTLQMCSALSLKICRSI